MTRLRRAARRAFRRSHLAAPTVAEWQEALDDIAGLRLDRTRTELEHALWFITSRGMRAEYETAAADRRRIAAEDAL